jgi:hypothetical protein
MVNSDRPRDTRPRSGEYHRRAVELVIGRMTDHGRANYQFRSDEDPSYYVKLLTTRGRKTLWGKDLERAINEGETQPCQPARKMDHRSASNFDQGRPAI